MQSTTVNNEHTRATKTIIRSAHGLDVQVSHVIRTRNNGIHEISVQAQVGSIVQQKVLTVGPQDSTAFRGSPPTIEQLQNKVDKHKTKLADEASWRYSVTENLKGLK